LKVDYTYHIGRNIAERPDSVRKHCLSPFVSSTTLSVLFCIGAYAVTSGPSFKPGSGVYDDSASLHQLIVGSQAGRLTWHLRRWLQVLITAFRRPGRRRQAFDMSLE
jgi:hypothetical protein